MWFEYWESKGIPAPKFEIGNKVILNFDDYDPNVPLKVSGIIRKDNSWMYQLAEYRVLPGLFFDEKDLKKAE